MAIPFLNNITLNNNEIQNVRLQNAGSPPLNSGPGQIYFNTGDTLAKYYSNITDTWVDIKEYSFPSVIAANGYITSTVTGTVPKPIITFNLNAADADAIEGERYLTKSNTWAEVSAIPGTYDWSIQGDTGGPTIVVSGTTIDIAGGTNVTTALVGNTLTINSTDQYVGTVTSVAPGTYISIDNTNPTAPIVNALGTTTATASRLIARDASGYGYAQTPASGDSSTKIATTAFVQAAVTGLLEFKGGFNANTGDLDSPLTTDLYTNTVLRTGDYYVVTAAGNFFGNAATPLTVGDSVICQKDVLTPGTTVATEADFIVVQSDTDLATLSTVGIGNVNAGTGINVAYSGGTATVSLAAQNSLTFTNTGPATAGTSYPITAATHGLGSNSSVIMVQVVQVSTGETIYTDVVRGASGLITITFAASQAINTFRALLQKIG